MTLPKTRQTSRRGVIQHQRLVGEKVLFGWFVRAHYIEDDDSYVLSWRLPTVDRVGPGDCGQKVYVNREELDFSYNYCAMLIKNHLGAENDMSKNNDSISFSE